MILAAIFAVAMITGCTQPSSPAGGGNGSAVTTKTIKAAPDAVGDIVLKNGTAIAYYDGLTLTDQEKADAIAVIFYAGGDKWDSKIPKTGRAAEAGCVGCPWYDIQKWREELQKLIDNK